jgi:hypothetical protein
VQELRHCAPCESQTKLLGHVLWPVVVQLPLPLQVWKWSVLPAQDDAPQWVVSGGKTQAPVPSQAVGLQAGSLPGLHWIVQQFPVPERPQKVERHWELSVQGDPAARPVVPPVVVPPVVLPPVVAPPVVLPPVDPVPEVDPPVEEAPVVPPEEVAAPVVEAPPVDAPPVVVPLPPVVDPASGPARLLPQAVANTARTIDAYLMMSASLMTLPSGIRPPDPAGKDDSSVSNTPEKT